MAIASRKGGNGGYARRSKNIANPKKVKRKFHKTDYHGKQALNQRVTLSTRRT